MHERQMEEGCASSTCKPPPGLDYTVDSGAAAADGMIQA